MRLFDLLGFLLLLAPSAIGLACVPAFIILLRIRRIKLAVTLVVLLVIVGILAALWTVYTFGMGFGPGILSFCLAPLMMAISLALLLILAPSSFRAFGADKARRRFYLIGGLLVAALQLSPIAGHFALGGVCDEQNRRIGNQIVIAVETYTKEHGTYPQKPGDLVPAYMPAWPAPVCSLPTTREPVLFISGFAFLPSTGGFMLTVPSANFGQAQIYDHATGQWRYKEMLD